MTVTPAIKFQAGRKLENESHKAPCLDLYFFFYIKNYLYNIINETSAPVIFADDTSIIFAHSNLTDFKKTFTKSFKL
jgi:hypothetical protein